MKHLFAICSMAILLSGCYYDNLEELHPSPPPCDTSHVISFSSDILPIFTSSCGNQNVACHVNDQGPGLYGLANYNDVKFAVDDLGSDMIYKIITHDPSISTTLWMPYQSSAKLDDCSIKKIEIWLRDTLNN